MKLNFKEFGGGRPLIILHGLLGSLDNWQTLAKKFGAHFHVFTVDQRNHGQSPHSDENNLDLMVDDIHEFIEYHQLEKPILMGHSLGGKTVMRYALQYPNNIEKLIVADMSPRSYPVHHQEIFDALNSVDFETLSTRKKVEEYLFKKLGNMAVVYFLTKNVYWKEKDKLGFRFNLKALTNSLSEMSIWPESDLTYEGATLFLRAAKANYIKEGEPSVSNYFPNAKIESIDAGHWLHAEKPDEYFEKVMDFLN